MSKHHFNLQDTKEQLLHVKKQLAHTVENLESAGKKAKKQAMEGCDNLESVIKDQPFKSVGIAILIGAAIALLIRR